MGEEFSVERLTEQEEQLWAEHCEKCFAYKPNPPAASYFLRHLHQDPWLDFNTIFVMKISQNNIRATIRLFDRHIFVSGTKVRLYGIGEVCTAPEARGQGLASQLMRECKMHAVSAHVKAMTLHCNEALLGFYSRFGFRTTLTEYTRMPLNPTMTAVRVEEVDVSDHDETLASLSNGFNARFVGSVVRSAEYVRMWLKAELGTVMAAFDERGSIYAHAAVKRKGDFIFLTDFSAADRVQDGEAFHDVLQSLIFAAVSALHCRENARNPHEELKCAPADESVLVPKPVMAKALDKSHVHSVDFVDMGWMYSLESPAMSAETQSLIFAEGKNERVFWMVDSF